MMMTLKQIFIQNLKEFRKKEGLSQMQLAEYCGISSGYIAEIEIGKKFPSVGIIEKIAVILKIAPYLLFKSHTKNSPAGTTAPPTHLPYYVNKQLQKQLKSYIKTHVNKSTSQILAEITEIVSQY
jgi:transcriptional regulator with XRE-family HTH domain